MQRNSGKSCRWLLAPRSEGVAGGVRRHEAAEGWATFVREFEADDAHRPFWKVFAWGLLATMSRCVALGAFINGAVLDRDNSRRAAHDPILFSTWVTILLAAIGGNALRPWLCTPDIC